VGEERQINNKVHDSRDRNIQEELEKTRRLVGEDW